MAKGKGKGSAFEREICKLLSLWWTKGERDDVFWRTSNSGGRATVRSRQGRQTFGQCGDIQATDPIGQPFIDLFSIELKRGYPKATIADLLDKPDHSVVQPFEKFIQQAIADHKKSKSYSWLLIVKRDRRRPIVIMPRKAYKKIIVKHLYSMRMFLTYRRSVTGGFQKIVILTLDDFLTIKQICFKNAHKEYCNG